MGHRYEEVGGSLSIVAALRQVGIICDSADPSEMAYSSSFEIVSRPDNGQTLLLGEYEVSSLPR